MKVDATIKSVFKHLIRKRLVSNKDSHKSLLGMSYYSSMYNPNYDKHLSFDDPRTNETWEQEYIYTYEILLDLDRRLRKLESQRK